MPEPHAAPDAAPATAPDAVPPHLALYTRGYFAGTDVRSGYTDYHTCRGILETWASMVDQLAQPSSVLDVGAAYGFLVEYFARCGIPAVGVEPSAFARSQAHPAVDIRAGALPDLTDALGEDYAADVVVCTEVLEHLPEALVPAAVQELASRTRRLLICLIMLEGPGADGDEGHICLKSASWWNGQFFHTGMLRRFDLEELLNTHRISKKMHWAGRFFVREAVA